MRFEPCGLSGRLVRHYPICCTVRGAFQMTCSDCKLFASPKTRFMKSPRVGMMPFVWFSGTREPLP